MSQESSRMSRELCPHSNCSWSGSLCRLLEHFRNCHDPSLMPANFIAVHNLKQCPKCLLWYLRLNQHSSKCKEHRSVAFQNSVINAVDESFSEPDTVVSDASGSDSLSRDTSGFAVYSEMQASTPSESSTSEAGHLPAFKEISFPDFQWGEREGLLVSEELSQIYEEVVFWKKNLFLVPSGRAGKKFVTEMTQLIEAYANGTAMEGIALKALVVLQVLLLQKPHSRSKSQEHVEHLQRRLGLWKSGRFDDLVREGRALQSRLQTSSTRVKEEDIPRVFSRLMIQGKVNAALRYLSDNSTGGVLSLDSVIEGSNGMTAQEVLRQKHPGKLAVSESTLLNGPVLDISPVIFDSIDGCTIKYAALRTQGAGGPSGLDSTAWRRLCCSFHSQSTELCNALAALTRRICTEFVDPRGIEALVACRLIPLDKCPGIRPIDIGETFRRIICKSIMTVVKNDVSCCCGALQVVQVRKVDARQLCMQ